MVNPDHVAVVKRDSISTPDVFGVDVCDSDVSVTVSIVFPPPSFSPWDFGTLLLNNNIACAADNPQPFPFDHTAGPRADKRFVGCHRDSEQTGVVTSRHGQHRFQRKQQHNGALQEPYYETSTEGASDS